MDRVRARNAGDSGDFRIPRRDPGVRRAGLPIDLQSWRQSTGAPGERRGASAGDIYAAAALDPDGAVAEAVPVGQHCRKPWRVADDENRESLRVALARLIDHVDAEHVASGRIGGGSRYRSGRVQRQAKWQPRVARERVGRCSPRCGDRDGAVRLTRRRIRQQPFSREMQRRYLKVDASVDRVEAVVEGEPDVVEPGSCRRSGYHAACERQAGRHAAASRCPNGRPREVYRRQGMEIHAADKGLGEVVVISDPEARDPEDRGLIDVLGSARDPQRKWIRPWSCRHTDDAGAGFRGKPRGQVRSERGAGRQ